MVGLYERQVQVLLWSVQTAGSSVATVVSCRQSTATVYGA